jgi:hypothetical protein
VDVSAHELAARGHASELGQLRRAQHGREQLDVERDAQQRGRLRAGADGGKDAVRRQPGRDGQGHARMQAVQQAADEAEHVHHRSQRHDTFAAARDAVDLRVALHLLDEARSITSDDLGGTRRSRAELDDDMVSGSRLARVRPHALGNFGEGA